MDGEGAAGKTAGLRYAARSYPGWFAHANEPSGAPPYPPTPPTHPPYDVGVVNFKRLRWRLGALGADVVIVIEAGLARRVRGRVKQGVLDDLTNFAKDNGVREGLVTVRRVDRSFKLSTAGDFEPGQLQAIRNIWAFHDR